MRFRIKILKFFVLFIILTLTSCQPAIKNLKNKNKAIVCFGDSLTEGIGLDSNQTYPAILEKLINRKVINAGRSGDTTISALDRLEEDVLSKEPYLVIVMLGGNDFLQQIPKETTLKNLEKIIRLIQSKGAIVVLCDISDGFFLAQYHNDLKKLAYKTNSIFVPHTLKGILTNPNLKIDSLHPNQKGYRLIAERIYLRIKRYI